VKILTCVEAAKLLDIRPDTLRDRVLRQGRCPAHRISPLSLKLVDVLNNALELTRSDRRGRKAITLATLREGI